MTGIRTQHVPCAPCNFLHLPVKPHHSLHGSTEQTCKRQEARGRNVAAPSRPCALRSRRALGGPRPWRAPLSGGAAVPLGKRAWHAERLPRGHARWHLRRVDSSSVALPRRGTPCNVSPERGGWTCHKRRMPAGMRQVVVWRRLWRRRRTKPAKIGRLEATLLK